MMTTPTKKDLAIILKQVKYVDAIRKKITSDGSVHLTPKDINKLDLLGQTLNGFRFYLMAHIMSDNKINRKHSS